MSDVIPFGKYRGRPVEDLLSDPGYMQWLQAQSWFGDRYPALLQVIVNRGSPPADTPEHNAIQVRFLDDAFCLQFARHVWPNLDKDAAAAVTAYREDRLKTATRGEEEADKGRQRAHQNMQLLKERGTAAARDLEWWQRDLDRSWDTLADARRELAKARAEAANPCVPEFYFEREFETKASTSS
jgi:hypothetical protein